MDSFPWILVDELADLLPFGALKKVQRAFADKEHWAKAMEHQWMNRYKLAVQVVVVPNPGGDRIYLDALKRLCKDEEMLDEEDSLEGWTPWDGEQISMARMQCLYIVESTVAPPPLGNLQLTDLQAIARVIRVPPYLNVPKRENPFDKVENRLYVGSFEMSNANVLKNLLGAVPKTFESIRLFGNGNHFNEVLEDLLSEVARKRTRLEITGSLGPDFSMSMIEFWNDRKTDFSALLDQWLTLEDVELVIKTWMNRNVRHAGGKRMCFHLMPLVWDVLVTMYGPAKIRNYWDFTHEVLSLKIDHPSKKSSLILSNFYGYMLREVEYFEE